MDINVERKERENDSNQQQINSYTRDVEEWAIVLSGEAYTSENSSVFGQETHVPLEQGENDDRPRASRLKLSGQKVVKRDEVKQSIFVCKDK